MARPKTIKEDVEDARRHLVEAEAEYQQTRADDYVTRLIRDAAIVEAHRAGLSSREISELVGDIGQPNVVRARRRAVTRREVIPDGLLSPTDALRASGLAPKEFITRVRSGRLRPVDLPGGVRAFRKEDVERLRTSAQLLLAVADPHGPVSFTLEEIASLVEDLMRISDELLASGDEVNAFLLDQVVSRLLDRAFRGER